MPDSNNRTTEAELSEAVLHILAESPDGEASYATLIKELPNRINLTAEDKTGSQTRPSEAVWEQRTRNITSHHASSENFIARGLLQSIPGGLRITDAGRRHIEV